MSNGLFKVLAPVSFQRTTSFEADIVNEKVVAEFYELSQKLVAITTANCVKDDEYVLPKLIASPF